MVAVRSGGHSGKAHRAPPAAALADERPAILPSVVFVLFLTYRADRAASLAILPIDGFRNAGGRCFT